MEKLFMGYKSVHDERTERILKHPEIVGIEDRVLWGVRELELHRRGSKSLATSIDVVIRTHNDLWLIEYKCGDGNRPKAVDQLHTAQGLIREYLRENPTLLYVHGHEYERELIYKPRSLTMWSVNEEQNK